MVLVSLVHQVKLVVVWNPNELLSVKVEGLKQLFEHLILRLELAQLDQVLLV